MEKRRMVFQHSPWVSSVGLNSPLSVWAMVRIFHML